MSLLSQLTSLHQEVLALISDLEALTRADQPRLDAVAGTRLKLTRASRKRTSLLEGTIYPLLLEAATPAERTRITALRQEGKDALHGSVEHIGRWTIAEIERRWADYRAASAKLRGAMRTRVADERALVYPLLAAKGDVTA